VQAYQVCFKGGLIAITWVPTNGGLVMTVFGIWWRDFASRLKQFPEQSFGISG
jgi:hypothetical protein